MGNSYSRHPLKAGTVQDFDDKDVEDDPYHVNRTVKGGRTGKSLDLVELSFSNLFIFFIELVSDDDFDQTLAPASYHAADTANHQSVSVGLIAGLVANEEAIR